MRVSVRFFTQGCIVGADTRRMPN
uniref:Peptidase S1 domain-containing protein n=1 Tax=Heterorhabditis bacteriophora TaxID=37862 RepID=A0A1I7X647_HETBA